MPSTTATILSTKLDETINWNFAKKTLEIISMLMNNVNNVNYIHKNRDDADHVNK